MKIQEKNCKLFVVGMLMFAATLCIGTPSFRVFTYDSPYGQQAQEARRQQAQAARRARRRQAQAALRRQAQAARRRQAQAAHGQQAS